VMTYWDKPEDQPELDDYEQEFAEFWRETPKLVFSKTLSDVEANARIVRGDAVEEVRKLKEEPGGDLAVGGAGLAASMIRAGLVDDFRLFVAPVALGAGRPYFPPLDERVPLELAETRTFGSRVVYLRYLRADA
jgi:dihydrofolate reductase